jgi:glycosyltransferase involved in cell wall biosynthesis
MNVTNSYCHVLIQLKMPPYISVSIIICTHNRAGSLQQTLNALGKVRVPFGCDAELIIADNASTDDTPRIVKGSTLENMRVIHLFEPKKGKSNALNSALAMARGEILVFTDDDVAPSEDWVEQILRNFEKIQCDALVGKLKLASHLERDWMKDLEKYYLAIPDFESGHSLHWVGANAAIHRRCLQRVPAFDTELGPAALGNAEDTLFGYQLVEAGFNLKYAGDVVVVHQPDESRLAHGAWLHAAQLRARSNAYLLHHWKHRKIKAAALKWLFCLLKLRLRRLLQPPPPLHSEGCPRWEWSYVHDLAFYWQYCIERRRPRNYARHGLEKFHTAGAAKPSIGLSRA